MNDFLSIYDECIHRDGADKLKEWLLRTDFFSAPASTRYHSSYEGGLCDHSVNVYHRLCTLVDNYWPGGNPPTEETIAIVSLLHDMCKVNVYKTEYRNRKNEMGVWEKYPVYVYDDHLCMGHGEGSLYIVSSFMKLSREEAIAISWHMGLGDVRFKGGDYTVNKVFEEHPLALLLNMADMMATYFDEN